jgi:RNA polymerase sigma-70 factor (ECF subfamily)
MTTDLDLLMKKISYGDEDAFGELYGLTKDKVFYTALSIVRDRGIAEDVMQETYIKVRRNVNGYKEKTNPLNWITSIARNTAINEYNRRKRESSVDPEESEYLFGTEDANIESSDTVKYMMKFLSMDERQIVTMHAVSGFKHSEIAEITDKPLGTVLWMYQKALKKLKKALKEEGL